MVEAIVITHATRTAIGFFGGALATVDATDLGATVIKSLLKKSGIDPSQIDEVILGQVLTAGAGQNPASQTALKAGIPETTICMTINEVCGSGLKAIHLAYQTIASGDAEVVIAGGQENMSLAAHVLDKSRKGNTRGSLELVDGMIIDGLWCAMENHHMGTTAENMPQEYGFAGEQQDAFPADFQQKTPAALKADVFADEITAVEIPQSKGDPLVFKQDEFPRVSTAAEALAELSPAFKHDGSVTAGNTSELNDGAAAIIMMTESKAFELGLSPLARIRSFSSAGADPATMDTGTIPVTRKCLQKAGWSIDEFAPIGFEAFAVQSLTADKSLPRETDKVNISARSASLGRPVGASGARVLVTLLHGMQRQSARRGLAALCVGGGQGVAMALELVD